jgi:FKBP-type peptidyl-prolyl cis-trans isomerase
MRKQQVFILLVVAICFGLIACKNQSPQIPANKGNAVDKNITTLLDINKTLASKEDSILQKYVKTKSDFTKNETGFWFKINHSANGPFLGKNDTFRCRIETFQLNGKEIKAEEKEIVLGKKQLVRGLEEGLKLMRKGESATFIIPWYLAYGMKGDGKLIPPYSSLVYEVDVLK